MRKPNEVLNSLQEHARNSAYVYERLYRNFYNPEFYYQAYQNIYSSQGNMTKGTDGKTIDGMSTKRVENIIKKMRDFSYQHNPARRVNIPKPNGNMRPLGIPSFEDKLVQEVARMIIEAIYETNFSELSHGFRPNKSCHTTVVQIRQKFKATKWFIEGDIVGFFDSIDHHILINILRKRIHDEQFIALIWKFLKAGYMEYKQYHKTYSGTPQGSIISPILSNIYLDQLDKYMEEYIESFNMGKRRADNKKYRTLMDKRRWLQEQKYSKEEWNELREEHKNDVLSKIQNISKELEKESSVNEMDENFKRLSYVRYADDFLCGVVGSKADALKIKEDIKTFINEKLHLSLSDEKTLITHGKDKAKFLGFEVFISNSFDRIRQKNGKTARKFNGIVKIYVPKEKWVKRLLEYGALKINFIDGKEQYEPIHRNCMVNNDDLEILNQFNSEIRGMYNFYRIADNVSVLNDYYYIMSYSMYKTYAAKYKTHISNIRRKYGVQNFAILYTDKKGKECKAYFYNEGFRVQRKVEVTNNLDNMPDNVENLNRSSLITRLKSNTCEVCGKSDCDVEIHHVRKLKDLKGKASWEKLMIARRRKTLCLCVECHDKLHAGKL
jgi:group II intron reverse transcriptase/maturase